MNEFPDFIIAGAAKSGTTSLSRYLNAHPDIYLPNRELNFYPFRNREVDYRVINHPVTTELEVYTRYFRNVTEPVKGEKSVSYFYMSYYERTIENILRLHPEPGSLRLIFLLRNPVDRAFSQYVHNREFHETLPFEQALDAWEKRKKEGWIPAYDYLGAGHYTEPLRSYKENFTHIRVFLFEDLQEKPEKILEELNTFLRVKPYSVIPYDVRFNVSKIPRNKPVHHLYQGLVVYNPLKYLVKLVAGTARYQKIKLSLLKYTHFKPVLSGDTRKQLVSYYSREMEELQGLLERDLSHWTEKKVF